MLHYCVMEKPSLIIVAVVLAALFAGGGYFTGRLLAPRTYTAETVTKTVYQGDGASADLAPLQAETAALKTQLDNLRAELAKLQAAAEAPAPEPAAEEPPRRMTRQERMEQLKRENPERYAEMERRRQANMEAFQTRREDFFANLDLELLTPEQQEMHFQYTEALAQQQAAIDRMRELAESGEEPTEEDRAAIRDSFRLVRGLQGAERDALLSAVATSMGLQAGEETETFVGVIKEVYDFTGMMPPAPMAPAGRANNQPPPPNAP